MKARTLIAFAALASVSTIGLARIGVARELSVLTLDKTVQDAVRQAYAQPFTAATAIPVRVDTWPGGLEALRGKPDGARDTWDIVEIRGDELLAACDEGLLEKLDWSQIGGRDHYLPQTASDCGVGAYMVGFVLAWDKDKFPGVPVWSDFWDVAKYPGKRGLWHGPRTNLEFALLADGVAPGDVYRLLRTSDGLDRAFRKLDQLKPYIVWWQSAADVSKILETGEVLMTSALSGRIALANAADHRHFGMQWTNSLSAVTSWSVIKGTPNLHQAQQFLYFVGDSAVEARLLPLILFPGPAKGLADVTGPGVLSELPIAPANASAALPIDEQFWRENQEKLTQRFNAWLEH